MTTTPWIQSEEVLAWTAPVGTLIKLTYFWRYSGRYVGTAEFYTDDHWDVLEEVLYLMRSNRLPDCRLNARMVSVLVESGGREPRLLTLPEED